jgi:MFS family permease
MAFLAILVVPLCIGAIVAAFFSTMWSWILIATAIAILLFLLIAVKLPKWKDIPELSEEANAMFKKYGHFYTWSDAARLCSSSASAVQFAAIIVVIINAFHSFWWGIPVAIVLWFIMAFVARAFNPTHYIRDPMEQLAHQEVLEYMRKKMRQQFEEHMNNASSTRSPSSTTSSPLR